METQGRTPKRWLKSSSIKLIPLSLACAALGALCAQPLDRCYLLDDEITPTIIRITDKSGEGYSDVLIISDSDGKNAERSMGNISNGVFSFPFPGRYLFDETQIRGEGSIIDGITGQAVECPDIDQYEFIAE